MASTEPDRLQNLKPLSSFSLMNSQCLFFFGFCLNFSLKEVLAPSAGIVVAAISNVRISAPAPINIPNALQFDLDGYFFFPRHTSAGFRSEFPALSNCPQLWALPGVKAAPSSGSGCLFKDGEPFLKHY